MNKTLNNSTPTPLGAQALVLEAAAISAGVSHSRLTRAKSVQDLEEAKKGLSFAIQIIDLLTAQKAS